MTYDHHTDLLETVATALAGRPVTVRLQRPFSRNAIGMMISQPGNRALIDIDPALDSDRFLKTFLHEVAHARFDYEPVTSEPWSALPPGLLQEYRTPAEHAPAESNADRWAGILYRAGKARAGGDDPVLILVCLHDMFARAGG